MNDSISKIDDNLDESIENAPMETYCKNMAAILIQNATDDVMRKKVQQELDLESLTREHAEIDKKIVAKLEEVKKTQKIRSELDREIYNRTQMSDQSQNRFKTTGDILKVLKHETEKFEDVATKLETRRVEVTKKIQGFLEHKKRNEDMKRRIEELENQVKEMVEQPEPTLNESLATQKEELRNHIQEKKAIFEMKRLKKTRMVEMKEQKIDLLVTINKRMEENRMKRDEVEDRKANIKKNMEEIEEKTQNMKEKIRNEEGKLDKIVQELTELKEIFPEKHLKVEEQKARISQKENELQKLMEDCAAKQDFIQKEQEKMQKEHENEQGKLSEVEKKIEAQMEQNAECINILNEKTEELANLKLQKEDLTERLYETKITVVTRQFENREQQKQNNDLGEKLHLEREEVEKIRNRNEELEKERKNIKKKLAQYPKELEEKREKLRRQQEEKLELLVKRQNLSAAHMEFHRERLNNSLKEAGDWKKKIQDLNDSKAWHEKETANRQANLRALNERLRREQQTYEKLTEQVRQREQRRSKSSKTIETEEDGPKRDIAPSPGCSGISRKNPAPAKESQEPEDIDVTETIENEDALSTSGRKSPGILKKSPKKSPRKPIRAQTPSKRVRFEGLSSESSSQSLGANTAETGKENMTIDELLKDLKSCAPRLVTRKRPMPMDF